MKNTDKIELVGLVVIERNTKDINRYEYFSIDDMQKAIARVHELHGMEWIDCNDMIFCNKFGVPVNNL